MTAEARRLEAETMMENLRFHARELPEIPVKEFDDDPEKAAREIRSWMNLPPGPVFNLTETLERSGAVVVVGHYGFHPAQDGFSQSPQKPPRFIHANSNQLSDLWRWTLARELGHLTMHTHEPTESPRAASKRANLFAAEFLVPAREASPFLENLTFTKLGTLKREWKVPMQALVARAYYLGCISVQQRKTTLARMSKSGYNSREPATLDPPVKPPSLTRQLAQRHLDELGYSRAELLDSLSVNETDFQRCYLSPEDSDILETLGVDEIIRLGERR